MCVSRDDSDIHDLVTFLLENEMKFYGDLEAYITYLLSTSLMDIYNITPEVFHAVFA